MLKTGLIMITLFSITGFTLAQKSKSDTKLKDRWELSVGYGIWYFVNEAELISDEELIQFPDQMELLNFSLAWHFLENLTANITVGLQIEKDTPPQ
jgi:hypothetical protein